MELNDKIRLKVMKLREEKGFSQSEFANKLGISRSHMNKLENGSLQISLIYLKQMSEVLQVPLEKLINDDNNSTFISNGKSELLPFDFEGVNKAILETHDEDNDYGLTMNPEDLLVTKEKLEKWKMSAQPGSIIIGSVACRYLIITTDLKPDPNKSGFAIVKYGFVNIDHASWQLCGPTFDSTDELIEWFASTIENPIINVISSRSVERCLPGEEYV